MTQYLEGSLDDKNKVHSRKITFDFSQWQESFSTGQSGQTGEPRKLQINILL